MTEQLPNSVKQALAKAQAEAGSTPHPDADLLTAFREGVVTSSERERLLAHLAVCPTCREVARLALPPAETPQLPQLQQTAPAPWWKRALAPGLGGTRWLSWASVVATITVVGSVGIIYRVQMHVAQQARIDAARQQARAAAVASTPPAALPPTANVATEQAKPAPSAAKAPVRSSDTTAAAERKTAVRPLFMPREPVAPATPAPRAELPSAPARLKAKAAPYAGAPAMQRRLSQAPEEQNALAAQKADSALEPARPAQKQPTARIGAGPARWRISANGELQRAVAGGEWQSVLIPANVRLQTVALVGANVWAGGSQASLFHSSDGGAHWEKVALPGRVSATITRIKFDDALHGTVEVGDGTTWDTSDGGHSWTLLKISD